MSELKRINNLIRDQDFFGLRVIKVPMKRHGLLSELIEQEQQNSSAKSNSAKTQLNGGATGGFDEVSYDPNESPLGGSDEENEKLLVRTLSIRRSMSDQGAQAANFLQRMDRDLKSIVNSTKCQKDSLEEVVATMTCKRIYPLQQQSTWLGGADCGMRWWSVLLAFIIIGFIAPLLYFVYIEINNPGS